MRGALRGRLSAALLLVVHLAGCGGEESPCVPHPGTSDPPADLASWCMVSLEGRAIVPRPGVTSFELNTALFSDGALKRRTVWMPSGTSALYPADGGVLDFPEGTVFTKSFGFPDDARKPQPVVRWIETRVEWRSGGAWHAVSYLWDDAQRRAELDPAGGVHDVRWIDASGTTQKADYLVPNQQQCRECHQDVRGLTPLGPKARNLNRSVSDRPDGGNQLEAWAAAGLLTGLPPHDAVPRLPVWNDPTTGDLPARTRAYLDVNCSHCHREGGAAENTALVLTLEEADLYHLGICKPPGGTGPGPGGRRWEIEPGAPDGSAIVYRMSSITPGIAMPQIGRSLVDAEGLALVRTWIEGLPGSCPGGPP